MSLFRIDMYVVIFVGLIAQGERFSCADRDSLHIRIHTASQVWILT